MNKHVLRFLSTVAICFILGLVGTGCGKKQTVVQKALDAQAIIEADKEISDFNSRVFAASNLSPDRGDYLLGPGDLLEIKVFEADKLNTTVRLSSRGEVSLPLLGDILLLGMTASAAEQLIEDKYKETYLKDPHVNIFVKEHYSQRVTVVGEVQNPGTYDYPSRQNLLDAIALAGGLTEKAGRLVQVRRLDSVSFGIHQTLMIDLDKLINEGKTELNIQINGGDVIFVPEAGSFYVDGAVRRPGEYQIKKTLSVDKALLAAGGCSSHADLSEISIFRDAGDGQMHEIKLDLEDAPERAGGIVIQDNDIIVVGASFWGSLFHGTRLNIGIPGLGISYSDPE